VNASQSAGQYTVTLDQVELGAGIYTANLTLVAQEGVTSRTIRIISRK